MAEDKDLTLTPIQKEFIVKILDFIAESPELQPFAYGVATGKTVALEALERSLHAVSKSPFIKS